MNENAYFPEKVHICILLLLSDVDWSDLVLVIVMIVLYVGAGAYAFSVLFDKWTIIDSIYFTVVTFTTW